MEGTSSNGNFKIESGVSVERNRLYIEYRNHLLKLQMMNSENFDKSILSLSSTLLALSLAFIKDIVDLKTAVNMPLLKCSWIFLAGAILITLISFLLSQLGISKQLKYAIEYYLNQNEDYFDKFNIYASLNKLSAYISALFFIIGIILTVLFVHYNI